MSQSQKALQAVLVEGITLAEAAERYGISTAAISKAKHHPSKKQLHATELDQLRAQLVASQATNKALIEVLVRILDNDGEEGSKRLDPMKHYQARVDAKALIAGQGGTEALDRLLAATYSEILNHLDGRIERVIEWAEWEFASSLRELRVDVAELAKQKGLTS